jgi:prepilin-type N-terminal cleavage/methylation domain-containing protein
MQESQAAAVSGQQSAVSRSRKGLFATRLSSPASGLRPLTSPRRGFTLTELLVVIAIIAMLAGLMAAAAVNALRNSKRARTLLEIKNISGAIENFKNDYGLYPPNGMNPGPVPTNPASGTIGAKVKADFARTFKKAFPRHNEHPDLINALAGVTPSTTTVVSSAVPDGMSSAEALYFWLGGFSSDEQYPISGPGGPSFFVADGEVLENRNRRYEFDLGRLGPRDDDGVFLDDPSDSRAGRFVVYKDPQNGNDRRINLWRYTPTGSEQPLVYFDTSRHKPFQYDPYASKTADNIFALKRIREGLAAPADISTLAISNIAFIDDKFQVLHCGLDDDWGDFGTSASSTTNTADLLLYPDGPFIGPIGDTLTNFADGELADESE